MRILVYEDITGGGCPEPPEGSLLVEGRAMRDALVEDLAAVPGVEVSVLQDERLGENCAAPTDAAVTLVARDEHKKRFRELAKSADWTLVVAPEFDDRLLQRAEDVEAVGGRLLGPDSSLIALCSDKFVLLDHLAQEGLSQNGGAALPRFHRSELPTPADFPFPAIWKPRFGAGSIGVITVDDVGQLPAQRSDCCLESRIEGRPLSVFVLKSETRHFVFPAIWQRLGGETGFQYLGGDGPVDAGCQAKVEVLVADVIESLPDFQGHLGIDLIYDPEESRLTLIEINPRVTTSYVGLRRLIDRNPAECMLDVATGGAPAWQVEGSVSFTADGRVEAS